MRVIVGERFDASEMVSSPKLRTAPLVEEVSSTRSWSTHGLRRCASQRNLSDAQQLHSARYHKLRDPIKAYGLKAERSSLASIRTASKKYYSAWASSRLTKTVLHLASVRVTCDSRQNCQQHFEATTTTYNTRMVSYLAPQIRLDSESLGVARIPQRISLA